MLKGKKIVVGVTGSIAAYKTPLLIRMLVKEGCQVRVIMTPVSRDFVTPLTLATLSRNSVIVEPFSPSSGEWSNHVELGIWADAMIFAPVTANTLGKMVNGIADNFVITAYLSAKCPVFIAPAMDLDMFNHPSTRKNIDILRSYGNFIIEPQTGELASGLSGPGRMEEPDKILAIFKTFFARQNQLIGKKVLITAGPTIERIDPVRYISNFSSGLMGVALANEAHSRGAEVTLVTGPSHPLTVSGGIKEVKVESAEEMYKACMKYFAQSEYIIMAAAVADYTPVKTAQNKIKKTSDNLSVNLHSTTDILRKMGQAKKNMQVLVGFALETENEIANAGNKLKNKNLDFIVLNSLKEKGAGFGTPTNKISILNADGIIHRGTIKPKEEVAKDIWDIISKK
ncbi:MAG: bifunctional phosphopantothenoylcysteine decarboxylase/phosphopantothenate--cysteine ligase CoaBC [Bacteroidetes bacterium]|nr:bifunctional phosphopantothenoylcysteine decarboxylase/phosphopantothenate--cysteine ligase CoaBC [Bacteroidota bacterium]